MIKTITKNAGFTGRKTNHSLKATRASRLYESEIDEQVIMEKTGHRSVQGVRSYKRTADVLVKNSSMILNGESLAKATKSQAASSPSRHIVYTFQNCNVVINNAASQKNSDL